MASPIQPRRPPPGRSLAELFPRVAIQWDAHANAPLTPDDLLPGSHLKVFWRCPRAEDHRWLAAVSDRAGGKGCPFCANLKVAPSNSLARLFPGVARTWHARNGALRPEHVVPPSPRAVWWKCAVADDHEWQAPIRERAEKGYGCPFCSGRRASSTHNLARRHPGIARLWHPRKNWPLRPADVTPSSETKVWWKCPEGPDHEWTEPVRDRIRGPSCAFCARRRISVTNCLATTHPQIARLWHPTKNAALTARNVFAGSQRPVWWLCSRGPDHVWRGLVFNIVASKGSCPFCSGRRVSVTNSLAGRFPRLARQWHPSKNGRRRPSTVTAGSEFLAWWKCPAADDHEWQARVAGRARHPGCPFCSHRRTTARTSLAALNPRIARLWHPTKNGRLRPSDVVPTAGREVWWRCPNGPDHAWKGRVCHAVSARQPCHFCAGRRVSVTNSLATLFPRVAREWNHARNRDVTPADVLAASRDLAWWRCALGHEWRAPVRQRTVRGQACPLCANAAVRIRHI